MKSNKKWLRDASRVGAEIGPEDGIDPRLLVKERQGDQSNHKALQLCKRAERTINLAFAGECFEPVFGELIVQNVELFPDGTQFLVSLCVRGQRNRHELESIAVTLGHAKGYVRTLIAQSIRRKRVPALRFRLVTSDQPGFFEKESPDADQ